LWVNKFIASKNMAFFSTEVSDDQYISSKRRTQLCAGTPPQSSLPKAADQQRKAVRYGGAQPVPQAIRFNTGWTGSWLARVGD
jgi:hypothetical protein